MFLFQHDELEQFLQAHVFIFSFAQMGLMIVLNFYKTLTILSCFPLFFYDFYVLGGERNKIGTKLHI